MKTFQDRFIYVLKSFKNKNNLLYFTLLVLLSSITNILRLYLKKNIMIDELDAQDNLINIGNIFIDQALVISLILTMMTLPLIQITTRIIKRYIK